MSMNGVNYGAHAPMVKYEQSPNRQQSVTDEQLTTIRSVGELETLLKGGQSGRVIDMRTSNISPEVWAALSRGEEVQVKLQQMAPERVNLFMPLVASVMQLIGGAQGASYNDALSQAVQGHVNKAADFVSRHGMSYSLNPFGGGQHIDVVAEFSVLSKPKEEKPETTPNTPQNNYGYPEPPRSDKKRGQNSVTAFDPKDIPVRDIKSEIADILDSKEFKLLKTKDGYATTFDWEAAAKSANMSVEQMKKMLEDSGINVDSLSQKELYAVKFLQKYQPKKGDIVANDGMGTLGGNYKDGKGGNTINSAVITDLDKPSSYANFPVEKGKAVDDYVRTALAGTEAFEGGLGNFTTPLHTGNGTEKEKDITPAKVQQAQAVFNKYASANPPINTVDGLLKKAGELAKSKNPKDHIAAGEIYAALLLQTENNARGNDGKGVSNGHLGAGHFGALQEAVIDRANVFVDGSRALNNIYNGGQVDAEESKGLSDLVSLYNKTHGTNLTVDSVSKDPKLAKDLLTFSKEGLTKVQSELVRSGMSESHPNLKALVGMIPNIIGSSNVVDGKARGIDGLIKKLDTPSVTTSEPPEQTTAFNKASALSKAITQINDAVLKDPKKPLVTLDDKSVEALISAGITKEQIDKIKSGDVETLKSVLTSVEQTLVGLKESVSTEEYKKQIDSLIGSSTNTNTGIKGLNNLIANPITPEIPSSEQVDAYVNSIAQHLNKAKELLAKDPSAQINGISPMEYAKQIDSTFQKFMLDNPGLVTQEQMNTVSTLMISLKARSGGYQEVPVTNNLIQDGMNQSTGISNNSTSSTSQSEGAPKKSNSFQKLKDAFEKKGINIKDDANLASVIEELKSKGQVGVAKVLEKDFKSMTEDEIKSASEFLGVDKGLIDKLVDNSKALDTLRTTAKTDIASIESTINSFLDSSKGNPRSLKGHIGRVLNAHLQQYKNAPEGSPQQIINLAKLQETIGLFQEGKFDFHGFKDKFSSLANKYREVDQAFSSGLSSGGVLSQDAINSILPKLPPELQEMFKKATSIPPSQLTSTSELGSFSVNSAPSGNQDPVANDVNQATQAGIQSANAIISGSSNGLTLDFSDSDIQQVVAMAPKLQSVSKYTEQGVITRDMLKTIEGRTEIMKMMNEEFSKEIVKMSADLPDENISAGESSGDVTPEQALAETANDTIRKAEELEAKAAEIDSNFSSEDANISKLLQELKDIVVKLEIDMSRLLGSVKNKKKQEKKSEVQSSDNNSTRNLLRELKKQLNEIHNKSAEELKSLSPNISASAKEVAKQSRDLAKKIKDEPEQYVINTIPQPDKVYIEQHMVA